MSTIPMSPIPMSPMSRFTAGAAALCIAGMFALTPASAAERASDGVRGQQAGQWEFSDQRRRYRPRRYYQRRYYAPRRYYRPYYYSPYYAYPRPYYRPYYRPSPFFPFF
jgi:hypothetical protein